MKSLAEVYPHLAEEWSEKNGLSPDKVSYGSSKKYYHEVAGMNSRTDEIQAAALSVKLPRLDADNERRRWIARAYDAGIGNPLITKPLIDNDLRGNVFYVYPIRTSYRELLMKWLREHQIETIIHYPVPPHKQPALQEFAELKLPVTEQIHKEILSLPISPLLSEREVARVIEAINQFNPG